MRVVSNTEVTSFNLCEQRHHYSNVLNLEPRYFNIPLTRGLQGHAALEAYYLRLKEGDTPVDAQQAAFEVIKQNTLGALEFTDIGNLETYLEMMLHLKDLLTRYFKYRPTEPFKVLEVEKVFQAPITDNIKYGLKVDLLVELTEGIYRGRIAIVDHKFTYNFKTPEELMLDGQLPKYKKTLLFNGINVQHCYFNQVRTRKIKDPTTSQLFKRTEDQVNTKAMENIWNEQTISAIKIVEGNYIPVRTLSPFVCKNCFFARLCAFDLRGDDTTLTRELEFQPSTYGYHDLLNIS